MGKYKTMGKYKSWTPEDEQYVLDSFNQGKTYKEIAKHLGIKPNAVKKKLQGLKKVAPDKTWTQEEINQLRQDVRVSTPSELARKYDCKYSDIAKQIRRFENEKARVEPVIRPKGVYSNPDYSNLIEHYASMNLFN